MHLTLTLEGDEPRVIAVALEQQITGLETLLLNNPPSTDTLREHVRGEIATGKGILKALDDAGVRPELRYRA